MIEVLILSLIQGVTEFLPISSSSHLILFSKLMLDGRDIRLESLRELTSSKYFFRSTLSGSTSNAKVKLLRVYSWVQ